MTSYISPTSASATAAAAAAATAAGNREGLPPDIQVVPFVVGSVGASAALLLTPDHLLFEIPKFLLPRGTRPGSIVKIAVAKDRITQSKAQSSIDLLVQDVCDDYADLDPVPPAISLEDSARFDGFTVKWSGGVGQPMSNNSLTTLPSDLQPRLDSRTGVAICCPDDVPTFELLLDGIPVFSVKGAAEICVPPEVPPKDNFESQYDYADDDKALSDVLKDVKKRTSAAQNGSSPFYSSGQNLRNSGKNPHRINEDDENDHDELDDDYYNDVSPLSMPPSPPPADALEEGFFNFVGLESNCVYEVHARLICPDGMIFESNRLSIRTASDPARVPLPRSPVAGLGNHAIMASGGAFSYSAVDVNDDVDIQFEGSQNNDNLQSENYLDYRMDDQPEQFDTVDEPDGQDFQMSLDIIEGIDTGTVMINSLSATSDNPSLSNIEYSSVFVEDESKQQLSVWDTQNELDFDIAEVIESQKSADSTLDVLSADSEPAAGTSFESDKVENIKNLGKKGGSKSKRSKGGRKQTAKSPYKRGGGDSEFQDVELHS